MSQQELLEVEPTVEPAAVPADSKWIAWISRDETTREVAGRVLDARLKAVCRALPLAAEKSGENIEYVHQLRIAVRRAVEAVRIFSRLMDAAEVDALRARLRQIRLAADEARNWDMLSERFAQGGNVPAAIVEQIEARRREVQGPIVAVSQEAAAEGCEVKFEALVREVETRDHAHGKRRFGRQAPKYLAPAVKRFFRAAQSDLSTDQALHELRIGTKKLRYTMEIVAVAFNSAFRKKLYPQVTLFQDLLGTVHDHATAKALLQDTLPKFDSAQDKAFLEGLLLAEEQAIEDLRAAFLAMWTPKVVSALKRQFRTYC